MCGSQCHLQKLRKLPTLIYNEETTNTTTFIPLDDQRNGNSCHFIRQQSATFTTINQMFFGFHGERIQGR